MEISAVAEAIRRDLLYKDAEVDTGPIEGRSIKCFHCRRAFTYRRRSDPELNGRFCSLRCQQAFDDPANRRVQHIRYFWTDGREMKPGFVKNEDGVRCGGFWINCPTCRADFVSLGLRYCSTRCTPKHLRDGCLTKGKLER